MAPPKKKILPQYTKNRLATLNIKTNNRHLMYRNLSCTVYTHFTARNPLAAHVFHAVLWYVFRWQAGWW